MTSNALAALLAGLAEIKALQLANPSPDEGSGLKKPEVARAIGRCEVVLLSSHFERFIYALNEEAVGAVCGSTALAETLPEKLKLEHSRFAIDTIARTGWEKRATALAQYSIEEGWLWSPGAHVGTLEAARLLAWMKTPNPESLVRVFQIWGIEDIFAAVTRKSVHRARFRLKLGELVEKRNFIAHGDFAVEATYLDIAQYVSAVREFCGRVDRRLARQVAFMISDHPW
jgi:hypothetical protein